MRLEGNSKLHEIRILKQGELLPFVNYLLQFIDI